MIRKIKNQNISHKAFTLIEMVIVLIIIWIMLMATIFLSWEQIQKVKNIILYGAGCEGQGIYRKIIRLGLYNIKAWVDRNWKAKRDEGLLVSPLDAIDDLKYDAVFIAMADEDIVKQVKIDLINMGIDKEKLIWVRNL